MGEVLKSEFDRKSQSRASFANRLRRVRSDVGLSQRDLERKSGIPKSRISRYENGHLLPSITGLKRLATSLGVADSVLLGDGEETYTTFVRVLRARGVAFQDGPEAEQAANIIADVLVRRTTTAKAAARSRAR